MFPLRHLCDVVLPPACAGCGLPGEPICAACDRALGSLPGPRCAACGAPWAVAVPRCPECRGPIDGGRQAVVYGEMARRLMGALKDGRRHDVGRALAEVVAGRLGPPPPGAVLVPVPASAARLRERGFDQARVVAERLGWCWGRPVRVVLVRPRAGPAQRGAPRATRLIQVRDAFAAVAGVVVPRHPVLVDDVRTTGATLAECARVLRAGGARRVGAVCVARAGRGGGVVAG